MAPAGGNAGKTWPALPQMTPPSASTPKSNNKTSKPEKKNTNETSTKTNQQIKVITTLAHEHNAAFPGSFNQVLNRLLRRNHIAEVDVGDDWPSAAILEAMEATPAQPHGEDPSMEATTLRDSPLPLAGAVFPSYWPEHELSFSEPSSPTSIPSPEKSSKNAKKKKKKKVRNLVQLSSEEEEETEETKPEKEEKPKEEIKTQEQEEKVEGEASIPEVKIMSPDVQIQGQALILPCGNRFALPPPKEGFYLQAAGRHDDLKWFPSGRGGLILQYSNPKTNDVNVLTYPYDFKTGSFY